MLFVSRNVIPVTQRAPCNLPLNMTRINDALITLLTGTDAPHDAFAERVLAAARAEFELVGIRRSNMIDIAKRAGVARATLYRRFPDKPALVEAIAVADIAHIAELMTREMEQEVSPETAISTFAVMIMRTIREHAILNRIRSTEPETMFSFAAEHGDDILALLRTLLVGYLGLMQQRSGASIDDPQIRAEILIRVLASVVLNPGGVIPVDNDKDVRAFARTYLVPIVLGYPAP